MPAHMDEFTERELVELSQYVKGKEQEQRELAQLQAEAIQRGPHGP